MGKRRKTKRSQRKGRTGKRPSAPRSEEMEASDSELEAEDPIAFLDASPDTPAHYCGDEGASDERNDGSDERDSP